MYLKIHRSFHQEVVALCDEELCGRTLRTRDLSLTISEGFYKGETKSEEEILAIVKQVRNVNAIGKKTIAFLLRHKLVDEENIHQIQGVPHVQVFTI